VLRNRKIAHLCEARALFFRKGTYRFAEEEERGVVRRVSYCSVGKKEENLLDNLPARDIKIRG